jgi:hypothetical protein
MAVLSLCGFSPLVVLCACPCWPVRIPSRRYSGGGRNTLFSFGPPNFVFAQRKLHNTRTLLEDNPHSFLFEPVSAMADACYAWQ